MSTLVLVRHGQASLFSGDYDRLSDLGVRQARLLGDYWARHAMRFDRAFIGPRRRHRETADEVAAAYAEAGLEFPNRELIPEKDEFDWEGVLAHATAVLAREDGRTAELHQRFEAAPADEKRRAFELLFAHVTGLWLKNGFEAPDVESFTAFRNRIHSALDAMLSGSAGGKRIVAFTSGGPAAIAVQRALALSPERAFDLLHTLRNGAFVTFLFTTNRFTLGSFNEAPHLPDPALWTHR